MQTAEDFTDERVFSAAVRTIEHEAIAMVLRKQESENAPHHVYVEVAVRSDLLNEKVVFKDRDRLTDGRREFKQLCPSFRSQHC